MTINDLTIDIKVDTSKAVTQINKMTTALKNLHTLLGGKWNNPFANMTFPTIPKMPGGGSGGRGSSGTARRAAANTKSLTSAFSALQKQAKSLISSLLTIPRAFARVAFYRAVRTTLKYIGEAFKEGGENAYWYSKLFGESTKYISEALDAVSSANFKATNQLGAAWVTLKAALAPIFVSIIGMVTNLAARITELFAAINGKTVFLRAKDYTKEAYENTAKGAKAAKEWKNQLMGFDVINRLEEPSSGGSGGGAAGADYENMFEEAEVSEEMLSKLERAKKIIDDIKNSVLVLWTMIKSGNFGALAAEISGGLASAATWFANLIKGIDFGKLSSDLFGGIISFLDHFDIGSVNGGLGKILENVFAGLGDFIRNIPAGTLILSFYDFINRAIAGVDWLGLLKSALYLVASAAAKLPSVLLSIFAETLDILSATLKFLSFGLGFDMGGGLVEGWAKKVKDFMQKVEDFFNDLVDKVKQLLGIHSPSTVFAEIGSNLIQGLFNGIQEKWEKVKSWFNTNVAKFFTASYWSGKFQSALGGLASIHIKLPHLQVEWEPVASNNFLSKIFGFTSIPHLSVNWYANGGFPEDGLFMANHSELVGKFSNGKTAVANNEQITQGIARAVYDAFTSAMGDGRSDDKPIIIMLDGKEVARSTTKYQRQMARAGGV